MTATSANLPNPASPVVGSDGRLSQEWFTFFLALLNRSGGAGAPIDIKAIQKTVNQQGGQIGDLFKLVNGQVAAPLLGALLQRVIALEMQVQSVVPVRQAIPQALPDAVSVRIPIPQSLPDRVAVPTKDPSTDLYKMVSK